MKQSLLERHFSIDVSTRAKREAFRNQSAWACLEKQKGYVSVCAYTGDFRGFWSLGTEVRGVCEPQNGGAGISRPHDRASCTLNCSAIYPAFLSNL